MQYKKINIQGTLLDKNQFEKYIEKIALDHVLRSSSLENTFPLKRLKDEYKFILDTYNMLNKHIKLGIKIHSAGEWILDNFYVIEETVKVLEKELTKKRYKSLIGVLNEKYYGFARIYCLAEEIIAYSDAKIDADLIDLAIKSYQKKKYLSMEEIADLNIYLKIALISRIKELCKKIYYSEIEKYKAESIVERLVDNKDKNKRIFDGKRKYELTDDNYKYSFIEYLSYKLKIYGKEALKYQVILENEVAKIGMTTKEVIEKEHLYIAGIKVTMGNAITSIRLLNRMDFSEIYSYMNITEELLRKDPSNVYAYMDEDSKKYYRNLVSKKSKKLKISEIYILEKILELCIKNKESNVEDKRKTHVGYYLIKKDGIEVLDKILEVKNKRQLDSNVKSRIYASSNILIPMYFSLVTFMILYLNNINIIVNIIFSIILYVPYQEIFIKLLNYVLGKLKKPNIIVKMNYENNIPKECTTAVVIPTILSSESKVKEIFEKLEVYYLANKLENLYFVLLGDTIESKKEYQEIDDRIINSGIEICEKLNKKYPKENINRFQFLYRKREWNDKEKSFLGWERKRGMLCKFNQYIKGEIKNDFLSNTFENEAELNNRDINLLLDVKYIITLDSDTELLINSASKLIGAMAHILNKPIVQNMKVVDGYGIMQPRIGIDLVSSQKNKFVELFASKGGIDFYTNAISDIYQDYFEEGIFTGKGIYDVELYNRILKGEIPENLVLSHDLLEGNYLRCGLLTNVMLLDGFPCSYLAYNMRNHRWIRGDWQINKWLKSDRLNVISKYKIFDNLRRSVMPIVAFLLFISFIVLQNFNINLSLLLFLSIIMIEIPYLIDVINYIVFKESSIYGAIISNKKFSKEKNGIFVSILRGIIEFLVLPFTFYINLDAIIKTLYRLNKKRKLLEWVTAEDGEKICKNNINYIYKKMIVNVLIGFLVLIISKLLILKIVGFLWILAPCIIYILGKNNKLEKDLSEESRNYLFSIAKKTWKYFEKFITEENNYLIPDNYQESNNKGIVNRTSSTNIGLELLVIISAYDMNFITFKALKEYLNKIFQTIEILSKWNGHLYNWYNVNDLSPLIPRYISTVDSGNFVGYLYVVKTFLKQNKNKGEFDDLILKIDNLINNTNFKYLYSEKNKLLSIGFNIEENKLSNSYYDFLASEARQASLVGIAKKDIPAKHWNNLSKTLTILNGYKGLVSWTGTAFEYLMPNITFESYKGSLLNESCMFAIMSQIEYSKKLGIPWGISESAFNLKDLYGNYQYKAFGIPWLGLKRGLENNIVVSPYSTFLALEQTKEYGISNLKKMEKIGAVGEYGFYDAIDYTNKRIKDKKGEIVKIFYAHHQGLIMVAINNMLNNNIIRKRFNDNPEIKSVNVLLQERMPKELIITKEKKEKIDKNKLLDKGSYTERIIEKANKLDKNINVISNEKYRIIMDDFGNSLSQYNDLMVNNYKKTNELFQGIKFWVKNINSKVIINPYENAKVIFAPDKIEFIKQEGNLKIKLLIFLDSNKAIEIRKLEIENVGIKDEVLEIISDFEPSLSEKMQEYSHPAFNKLFMKFYNERDNIIFEKINREKNEKIYLATNLYTECNQIVDFEYEISSERYNGRENYLVPNLVKNTVKFSNEIKRVVDPHIALKRTIKIKSKEEANISLIISVDKSMDIAIEELENAKSEEEIERTKKLAKIKSEEELKYLKIDSKKLDTFMKLEKSILNKKWNSSNINLSSGLINSLWKYGISGDNPIVSLKIRNIEDIYLLEEMMDLYEYYIAKKIRFDFVIIDEEIELYEKYVNELIREVILNKQLWYLVEEKNGIYIINKYSSLEEDIKNIEYRSNLVIDSKIGSLDSLIEEIDSWSKNNEIKKEKIQVTEQEEYPLKNQDLELDNGFGGFQSDGKEYVIYKRFDKKLPAPWSNVLANQHFGTVMTDNFGGYTWSKNSRLNRITSWNNDKIKDLPSEIIYIKDEKNKEYWTVNSGVYPNKNYYYIVNGFGYSRYFNTYDNLYQNIEVFVPNEESKKILNITLKNLINEKRELKLLFYIKIVLGEDEIKTNGNLKLEKINNDLIIKNLFSDEVYKNKVLCIECTENINSYTGEENDFLGNGNIICPDALYKNLNNESKNNSIQILGIEIKLNIEKLEEKKLSISIGEKDENKIFEISNNDSIKFNVADSEKMLVNVKKKWNDLLTQIKVVTPDESINYLMNGWLMYQTLASRIYAKTGYYQSGGAFGFRDQLQDSMGLKYLDSKYLKNQIINAARHQFIEGDVLHWWHIDTKKGIRSKISDDVLWLVYSVIEYIEFENDKEILNEEIEYLKGDILSENEVEKYNTFFESSQKETLYNHLIRGINYLVDKGMNPFPKIGTGDWNDGFNNLGKNGIGQSIWLGFFLYDVLNRFIPIIKDISNEEIIKKYSDIKNKLKKDLNQYGWDGRWFRRAIDDFGNVIGSIENDECRIDSICQSWAVISNAGDNDKKYIAMQEVENYLVDRENKIIKLFDPAFEKSKIDPGYIKYYPVGVRENGGQYTHAACWVIIAEAILGFGDKALEYAKMINPIEHSKTTEDAKKFKLEPYVIEADIYSNKDMNGMGGWNWYTGSASWYYKAILEYILGLKIKNGYMKIEPCISSNWKEYEIQYKYKSSIYNIKVKNYNSKNTGVSKVIKNGEILDNGEIALCDDCRINYIEIFM